MRTLPPKPYYVLSLKAASFTLSKISAFYFFIYGNRILLKPIIFAKVFGGTEL